MRKLEIYIHIPFCVRKCAYCDFLSVAAGREQRDRYVKTLLEEIRSGIPVNAPYAEDGDYIVTSVFFGGGTPSVLPADQIAEIMGALRSQFRFSEDAEISLECNPGTFGELLPDDSGFPACELGGTSAAGTKPEEWFGCGINRLSIGLQSADNAELAQLGRIHTWEIFLESYEKARQAGFRNINIDLMSALPGQTAASWEKTLRQVLQLAPEHISAYSLIIEEGTPFYQKYHEDDLRRMNGAQPLYLSSEEEERKMYVLTGALLDEAGFQHYEISNYARPGLECRHNIGYWQGTEYMGFGLGASSFLKY
ncbi:MAG: radical SAM protein, partial [Lachnospiraceae bacterium]|nr:radical SAM protein [Lachnospiraceae bacterium]